MLQASSEWNALSDDVKAEWKAKAAEGNAMTDGASHDAGAETGEEEDEGAATA